MEHRKWLEHTNVNRKGDEVMTTSMEMAFVKALTQWDKCPEWMPSDLKSLREDADGETTGVRLQQEEEATQNAVG